MARLSERGLSSDPNFDRFTSDQLERFKDEIRDDIAGRHDGTVRFARKHEPPEYLKKFGDAELEKHNYTLDLERAKRGDPAAAARVRAAGMNGLVPVGISMAQQLAAERFKQLEEETRRKAKDDEYNQEWRAEQRRKIQARQAEVRLLEERIKAMERLFNDGRVSAAVDVAKLYLVHPDLNAMRFKLARNWLNRAKDSGIVDIDLLRLFARTCARSPIPGIAKHAKRYKKLIREVFKAHSHLVRR